MSPGATLNQAIPEGSLLMKSCSCSAEKIISGLGSFVRRFRLISWDSLERGCCYSTQDIVTGLINQANTASVSASTSAWCPAKPKHKHASLLVKPCTEFLQIFQTFLVVTNVLVLFNEFFQKSLYNRYLKKAHQ